MEIPPDSYKGKELPVDISNESRNAVDPQTGDMARQGKVNYHGPPVQLASDGGRSLRQQLQVKDEQLSQLRAELQLSFGKIKGYQTLAQLYQESRQECSRYKQLNEELANKLDVVVRRLLPEKDLALASSPVSHNQEQQFTTAAVETPSRNLPEKCEALSFKEESNKSGDDPGMVAACGENLQKEDPCEEMSLEAEDDRKDNSQNRSSISSPSFICLGGSGLSSVNQTPSLGSLPDETETEATIGNRPTIVDESPTDIHALNDYLSDPKCSLELRAMAADLIRVGGRAAKIEKQARVQQVLLDEMRSAKASLVEELRTKKQDFEELKAKYSAMVKKLREKNEDVTGSDLIANAGSLSSVEWVEVEKQQSSYDDSLPLETVKAVPMVEMQLRSEVQKLKAKVTELEIMQQSLTDGLDHSDRTNKMLHLKLCDLQQQLRTNQDNDLKRQEEFDRMLLTSKKKCEVLEMEREDALRQQLIEKHQRMKLEDGSQALREEISRLENKVRLLEKSGSLKQLNASPPSSSASPAKSPEPVLPPSSATFLTDLSILQQQVTIYKQDFDHERMDREVAQSHLEAAKLQLVETKSDLDCAEKRIRSLLSDLRESKAENDELKKKFIEVLDDMRILKNQIRGTPMVPSVVPYSHPRVFDVRWTCKRCTFENPEVRQTCEMCGIFRSGSRAGGDYRSPQVEMEYTGRGSAFRTSSSGPEAGYCSPLEEDRSPHSQTRSPPEL